MSEKMNRYLIVPKYTGDEETYIDENGVERPKGWRDIGFLPNPAIIEKGLAFGSETAEKKLLFANDYKMRVAAPLSIPMVVKRKPITEEEGNTEFNDGKPFEVEWTAENIEKFLVGFMKNPNNLKDIFNYRHDENVKIPAYILEIWMVDDPKRDRSFSTFGIEVPKGTVFVVVQVTDKEWFNKLVEEDSLGLSVEGRFGLELKMGAEETPMNYADVLILNPKGEVQMLHRKDTDEFEPNKWGFPGGKIEAGENPIDGAKRETFEETGWEIDDLKELEVIENEDGSVTHYFVAIREDEMPCYPSEEHDESEFMSMQEIEQSDVIMGQNERFTRLLSKAQEQIKQNPMNEGDKFEIAGVEYIVKDGKPVPVSDEKEVEQAVEEKEKDENGNPIEKEEEMAEEQPPAPAPAEGLTEEMVVSLIQKEVKPMIEEAMKAVVDATVETATTDEGGEQEQQFAEEKPATEKKNPLAGFAEWASKKA